MGVTSFLGNVLKGALQTDYVRDYQHASRTFRSNNYALLPKTKRWWHVVFEINQSAKAVIQAARADMGGKDSRYGGADWSDRDGNTKISVLAKTVKLPSYRFETKRYNQYNRQVLAINRIGYEAISASFHDDSLNLIRNFWDAYYTYHVMDSRYRRMDKIKSSSNGLPIPTQWSQDSAFYSPLYTENYPQYWGLDTVNGEGQILDRKTPFFDSIKIYHFSRPVDMAGSEEDQFPHYAEYTLVNPIITSFEHDTLEYASSDAAGNNMNIEYETVLYAQGVLDSKASEVPTWAATTGVYYDNSASPLGNPSASIFGSSGLLSTGASVVGDIKGGNLLGAALTAGRAVTTWKSSGGVAGLINSASQEAKTIVNNSLTGIQRNLQTGDKDITVPNRNLATIFTQAASTPLKPPVR
jgi:hypothetical protein